MNNCLGMYRRLLLDTFFIPDGNVMIMKIKYNRQFYQSSHEERFVYSANTILPIVIKNIPLVSSAIDVGCGSGIWLSCLQNLNRELGRNEIEVCGIEGYWIDENIVKLDKENFRRLDLFEMPYPSIKRYDLAISLEVAEHLPKKNATAFVQFLTSLSDFVLFSAAIPYQGGTNHLNEQWQGYWKEIFEENNYTLIDLVRPIVWDDEKIHTHYRQNTFLYCKTERVGEIKYSNNSPIISVVHPEHYKRFLEPGLKRLFIQGWLFQITWNALKKSFICLSQQLFGKRS